jgi:hypothetical protein
MPRYLHLTRSPRFHLGIGIFEGLQRSCFSSPKRLLFVGFERLLHAHTFVLDLYELGYYLVDDCDGVIQALALVCWSSVRHAWWIQWDLLGSRQCAASPAMVTLPPLLFQKTVAQ